MKRETATLLGTLVALGGFAACLDVGSVEESPPATGGMGGSSGDAASETTPWPDGAGGQAGATGGASSDADDAPDPSDGSTSDVSVPDSSTSDASDASDAVADAGSTYAAEVLKDKPDLYWRLDELSGPTALDSSGKGNHGNYLSTTITYGVPGALKNEANSAVLLAGGYLEAGDVFDFVGKSHYTVELWVKVSSLQTDYARVVSKEDVPGSRDGWTLFFDNNPEALKFERWRSDNVNVVAYPTSMATATFRHVAAAYDGIQLYLYLDGKLVAAKASSLELIDLPNPLRVGALTSTSNKVAGAIDELAIYPTALSAVRIAAHYSAAGY